MSKRFITLKYLQQVLEEKRSLTEVLGGLADTKNPDNSFISALCYGVLRHYWQLQFIARKLLQKPLKEKDEDVHLLILMGLFELIHLNTAPHAATSETVEVCLELKKEWAKSLVNAILRNFLRSKESLLKSCEESISATFNHPAWLNKLIQKNWPEEANAILIANNQQAPMSLRVNQTKSDEASYLLKLTETGIAATKHPVIGITLTEACDVYALPDFATGAVSVQDPSAQLAATLLQPHNNDTILDACAAPGGKTTHILELAPQCKLTAVEIDKLRTKRIFDNLQRLNINFSPSTVVPRLDRIRTSSRGLSAGSILDDRDPANKSREDVGADKPRDDESYVNVITANVNLLETWWNKISFDKILCDAPCSASGVIRRHPDIKHLRQKDDLIHLAEQQLKLLKTLWQTLKFGGTLLYCTCSIFKDENDEVIEAFLSDTKDAKVSPIEKNTGHNTLYGKQILPGENDMDGFYYCLLTKI